LAEEIIKTNLPRRLLLMGSFRIARTLLLIGIAPAWLLVAVPRAGCQGSGNSYMRIAVNGVPVYNFSTNSKYKGWLGILMLDVLSSDRSIDTSRKVARSRGKITDPVEIAWKDAALIAKTGRPGEMTFLAGDDGGFAPLIEAMKRQTVISEAMLDLYNVDTNKFVGRFGLKGVRAISIEDNSDSACPEYIVRLRFRSITPFGRPGQN
jgi:hypothetical protein